MGGVGKTTIAVALVRDEEIRAYFEIIVWASVGQEPNIRELQESIHFQLTGRLLPDEANHDAGVRKALKNAAVNRKVLLVLDDLW